MFKRSLNTVSRLFQKHSDGMNISKFDLLSSSLPSSSLVVNSITHHGAVVGDLTVEGPCIILNNTLFLWDVPQYGAGNIDPKVDSKEDPTSPFYGWTMDMFKIFECVGPRPEILVIGTGSKTHQLPAHIKNGLISLGMQIEVCQSKSAGSTYNVLLQEERKVAAALLPIIPTSAKTGKPLFKLEKSP